MKRILTLTLALLMFIPSISLAEIRVYDANDQFLGILLDANLDNPSASNAEQTHVEIFIPTLNTVTTIRAGWPDWQDAGTITHLNGSLTYFHEDPDCTGTLYTWGAGLGVTGLWFDMSTSKYYITIPGVVEASIMSSRSPGQECLNQPTPYLRNDVFRTIEVPEQGIPFTMPVALPLRYEYVNLFFKGDFDNDGDVDAADLGNFSQEFGR